MDSNVDKKILTQEEEKRWIQMFIDTLEIYKKRKLYKKMRFDRHK
jgi:hypothetical protein